MASDALAVANYFLDKAKSEGKTLDPLSLQKLVYFAHGWHLAIFGQPLINQRVEAWDYGPVIQDIYGEFRQFGRGPITKKATTLDVSNDRGTFSLDDLHFVEPKLDMDDEKRGLLDKVWKEYGKFSGIQLSNLTHTDDSPWAQTRRENPGIRRSVISDEAIKAFFKAQARANAARKRQRAEA